MLNKIKEEFEKWYLEEMPKVRQGLRQENDPVKDLAWAIWQSRDKEITELKNELTDRKQECIGYQGEMIKLTLQDAQAPILNTLDRDNIAKTYYQKGKESRDEEIKKLREGLTKINTLIKMADMKAIVTNHITKKQMLELLLKVDKIVSETLRRLNKCLK